MEVSHLQILRTDTSGMPLEWIGYQEAVKLYYLDQVAYSCGNTLCALRGGVNAASGKRSLLEINSILATHCPNTTRFKNFRNYTPPLNNAALFRRDNHLCLYCGRHFSRWELSRDHITPVSQGGADIWSNVVTACKRCNSHKAGRTPEQADMQLLAIPFVPTHAEYIYLQGHMILLDQMEFLRAHFPRSSPLITRDA
jgi:5-methylcytosine-specific restriction endonuclease McrA